MNIKDQPKTLCVSCRYSTQVKRYDRNDATFHCNAGDSPFRSTQRLPQIEKCSAYVKRGAMTLSEMSQTGWILDSQPGNPIGFVAPGTKRFEELIKDRYSAPKSDPAQLMGPD